MSNPLEFQATLNAAANNSESDTIQVAEGIYNITTTLTYASSETHYLTITSAGKGLSILDGGKSAQILTLSSLGDDGFLVVQDITFRNGNSDYGGGLYIETATALIKVDNCEFIDNIASDVGGGLNAYSTSGFISISDCMFSGNASVRAGGLFAQTESGLSMSLLNSTFEDNYCTVDGGGAMLYPLGENASLTIENNHFENNRAGQFGGGCWSRMPAGNSMMMYCHNSFSGDSALAEGGGGTYIEMHSGTLNYSNNSNKNNYARQDGGGAWIWNESGTLTLSDNSFTQNNATNNGGGASVMTDAGTLWFNKNVLDSNVSGNVGGGLNIATMDGMLNVVNNTFYGNSAIEGGSIYFYFDQITSNANVTNNIMWQDSPPCIGYSGFQTVVARYSNIQNGNGEAWFGTGCIDTDPLFADPAWGDFNLTWNHYPMNDNTKSPCIDSGDPTSLHDPDGTVADMGAFPFSQSTGINENFQSDSINPMRLCQNYPNPFNLLTTITYTISKSDRVTIRIYNMGGEEVDLLIDGFQLPGEYQINWHAKDLPSGIYFLRLQAKEDIETHKLILLR